MANSGGISRRQRRVFSRRTIPKRGKVKVAIVTGIAHSLASIFSFSHRNIVVVATPLS
ncbi:hypothetical protein LINPERPRIM_LOCUS31349 [Linum perenne]